MRSSLAVEELAGVAYAGVPLVTSRDQVLGANRAYRLSASIGGAAYDPQQPERVEALLARADALMCEQKRLRRTLGKSLYPARG